MKTVKEFSKNDNYLNDMSEVFSRYKVVCLDEYFSQSALSYWVVLGVELIKSVERVTILKIMENDSCSFKIISKHVTEYILYVPIVTDKTKCISQTWN